MREFDGLVALVTGAGRGIGAAIARRLAAGGATVVLADVLDAETASMAGEIGGAATAVHLDVSSAAEWTTVVAGIGETYGRLDILVNNAGILRTGSIETMALEEYLAVIGVNQVGPWLGIKTVTPLMRRSGGGSIVNLSSLAALGGIPDTSAYCATKSAVRSLTKVAALELAASGIRVNAVLPGAVDTAMSTRAQAAATADVNPFAGQPIDRAARPAEIAEMVAFIIGGATYCTGADFVVDGGVTSALPSGTAVTP